MTKENLTSIAIILDASGSMSSLQKDTIGSFNTLLREQKAVPGEAKLTTAIFSDSYRLLHDDILLNDASELTEADYKCSGSTALLDAIGKTIDVMGSRFASMPEHERPSKILVVITTDGEENSSCAYKHAQIKEMVSHQRDKYNWEFVFVGANIDSFSVASSMGVSANSTYNYSASKVGMANLYSNISSGTTAYRNSVVGTSFNMADPMQGIAGASQSTPSVITGTVSPMVSGQTVSVSKSDNDTK
jgi:hypothetical protein